MFHTLLVAAAVMSANPAHFTTIDGGDAPQVLVNYADLNLNSIQGRAALEKRVAGAVRRVCPDAYGADLGQLHAMADCRKTARRDAAVQIARADTSASQGTELAFAGR